MPPEVSSTPAATLDDLPATGFHSKLALISAGAILRWLYSRNHRNRSPFHCSGASPQWRRDGPCGRGCIGWRSGGRNAGRGGFGSPWQTSTFHAEYRSIRHLLASAGHMFRPDIPDRPSLPSRRGRRCGLSHRNVLRHGIHATQTPWPRTFRTDTGLVGRIYSKLCCGLRALLFPGISWRVMLVSSAVPSLVLFCLRMGLPESPRWLVQQGRIDDARNVVRDHLKTDILPKAESQGQLSLLQIIRSPYRRALMFVSAFWILQSAPGFAIHTLQAQLLHQYHVQNALLGSLCITGLTILGILPVTLGLINLIGRRLLLIGTFAFSLAGLLLLGVSPTPAGWMIFAGFILYSMSEAAGSGLQFVYPNELFPTAIRASAVGMACSFSRIGAALGTFLLPLGYARFGMQPMMLTAAGFMLAGLLISWIWAPETKGVVLGATPSLTEPLPSSICAS